MGTVGLPENSPPPGSASRLPTTPLCASTTGSGRRPWPISSRPPSCIRSSIAMPGSAVQVRRLRTVLPLEPDAGRVRHCRVNDSVVRLGVMQGEYHWHKHDNDDEFFYVLSGRFIIDLEGRSVELLPNQGFVLPKGVMHCTRAPEKSVILMVETAAIVPTGDA